MISVITFPEGTSRGNDSLTQTQRVRNPNSAAKSVTFAEVNEKNQTLPPSTSEVLLKLYHADF